MTLASESRIAPVEEPRFARPRAWHRLLGYGANLIFPPECAFCHQPMDNAAGRLCDSCMEKLFDSGPACERCGATQHPTATECVRCRDQKYHFQSVLRLGVYSGLLRQATLWTKSDRHRALSMALGDHLGIAALARMAQWQADAVMPVPMHWTRRLRRGTNGAALLAERVAQRLGLPLAGTLLLRHRRTMLQANLSPRQRVANVRGAFRVRMHRDLPGARLILVDDIMTTGATANEVAKVLTKAGAQVVGLAVVARGEGAA